MRQQLLAHEMETVGKEAESVSVLHLSPRANHDFRRITAPAVRDWAAKEFSAQRLEVTEAWSRLVKHQGSRSTGRDLALCLAGPVLQTYYET